MILLNVKKCDCGTKEKPILESVYCYRLTYFVKCSDCGKRTGSCDSEGMAISQWRKIANEY